jgi:DNA-binding response OmpR family regulator
VSGAAAASVLVVDDDQEMIENLSRILRLEGHRVETASSGRAGLVRADAMRPDAIIVDLQMPNVDGVEFLRRLRAGTGHLHTPVAVVTGNYFIEDRVMAELRGLGAQIHYKPLWFEDIVALVNGLLDSTSARGTT